MNKDSGPQYRVFPGWGVVAGAFIANGMFSVVALHALGFIFKYMSQDLGWSRGAISVAFAFRSLSNGVLGPIIGPKIDAWGPRPFIVVAALAGGISTILLGVVSELWQFYLLFGVIGGASFMGIGFLVTATAVSKWFVRFRGRALAIADLGNSVGAVLLVPTIPFLITFLGWRGTWIVLGALATICIFPTAFLMRRQPEDYGLRPDGISPDVVMGQGMSDNPDAFDVSLTRRQAVQTPAFWLLILAFSAAGPGVMGVGFHQIPHITDRGFSDVQAAMTLTVWAFCAGFARVGFGLMAERIPTRYLMVVVMVGSGLGVGVLLWLPNIWALYLFAVVYGLLRGPYVIMNNLVWAEYFGRRHLGAIRGLMTPFNVISFGAGPILAGILFDRHGDYNLALELFIGGYFLAGLLFFLAKPPRLNTFDT